MNLNDVHRGVVKHRVRKRVGRGKGTGLGKTSGRGHKGQGARAGWSCHPTFEGGQMPLVRRIPKRGFHNRFAATVAIVNLADLQKQFAAGEEVNPLTLRNRALVRGSYDVLKVLGNGELNKPLRVAAHRFSKSAQEKIRQAGGEVIVLPGAQPVAKNKQKAKAP
jgi:large subunit ribosomal protein L15